MVSELKKITAEDKIEISWNPKGNIDNENLFPIEHKQEQTKLWYLVLLLCGYSKRIMKFKGLIYIYLDICVCVFRTEFFIFH